MPVIDLSQNNKLIQHAERELALAGLSNNSNPDVAQKANYALSIIRLMSTQQHSPQSVDNVLQIVRALAMMQIISPLTANPTEWQIDREGVKRNRRYPSVVMDEAGIAYNEGAIAWGTPDGKWFTGTLETGETSKQPLKLPGYPQVVKIDVDADNKPIKPEHYLQAVEYFSKQPEPEPEPEPEK